MSPSSPVSTVIVCWIGIDWADQEHVISLKAVDSPTVERLQLRQQSEALQDWIQQLRQRFAGRPVAIALEQSRGPLLYALMHTDFLYLYPINPKSLARYREAFYPSGAKDDPEDADLLREMVEKNPERFRCWTPEDPLTRQLQLAVEYRRKLVTATHGSDQPAHQLAEKLFPPGAGMGRGPGYRPSL